jgi:hypothetical protein
MLYVRTAEVPGSIVARQYVPAGGCPLLRGREFGDTFHQLGVSLLRMTIDLSGLEPALIISGFIAEFLQRVHELDPGLCVAVGEATWIVDHDFQADNVREWVSNFDPLTSPAECVS